MKLKQALLPLLSLLLSCGKPEESAQPVAPKPTSPKSTRKEPSNFAFLKAHNPGLTNDYPVSFQGTGALVTLPANTDFQSLKPSFSHSAGASVTVGGVRQESGVTSNNFTHPVIYQVTAEDGSQQVFTVEVSSQQNLAAVDDDIQTFMTRYNLPGLSLAITKDERLVYAKGYGLADKEQKIAVSVRSQFRIASISKSITAMAVLKLVEEGRLQLDQTVFGPKGLLGTEYGKQPYRSGVEQITVRHLLQHTAGGNWPNIGNDPLYVDGNNSPYPPNTPLSTIISNTLDQQLLAATPGTMYNYTNFGYCLLGRTIEKVTGQRYESYVKEGILGKVNITDMQLGSDSPNVRAVDEVIYYEAYPGRYGFKPYMYPAQRYDAAGGWIASASQLARLLTHVDGFSRRQDMLSATTLRDMLMPTQQSNYTYGMGWSVSQSHTNYWHTGSMQGTSTIWVRYAGGYNVVILSNTYPSDDATYWNSVYQLANDVVAKGNPSFIKGDQF